MAKETLREKKTLCEKEIGILGETLDVLRRRVHVTEKSVNSHAGMGGNTYQKCIKGATKA